MPGFPTKFRVPYVQSTKDPGSLCSGRATLNFGTGNFQATAVVTGQTWVRSGSRILASVSAVPTAGRRAEEAMLEGITCYIGSLVEGEGFTIYANAPLGALGTFYVDWVAGA